MNNPTYTQAFHRLNALSHRAGRRALRSRNWDAAAARELLTESRVALAGVDPLSSRRRLQQDQDSSQSQVPSQDLMSQLSKVCLSCDSF